MDKRDFDGFSNGLIISGLSTEQRSEKNDISVELEGMKSSRPDEYRFIDDIAQLILRFYVRKEKPDGFYEWLRQTDPGRIHATQYFGIGNLYIFTLQYISFKKDTAEEVLNKDQVKYLLFLVDLKYTGYLSN
jgi:hypothetical protein